ncbi:Tat pathway signal sequence domain protein [Actinomyces johnsonii F0510]|uniref:Tat pathway signal sequence domain protein n=1 Tax=Actinomyces johnsonii F0510 TaxID=1227262 RepID=U1RTL5_9ACTO|nr:Tat pathway signal sequence domain protein [Actinomyces johnsonii]ERH21792.1 Tat pathway signal sequence domain protein [Actinomyces johnsonii F0510]
MNLSRRTVLTALPAAAGVLGLGACSSGGTASQASATASSQAPTDPKLTLDSAAWRYDATGDVYYQLGLSYVATPQASDYETLGIYVPGAYFTGTDNGNGTYTATINASGAVGSFTAATAPTVLPVNTPGYSAQKPPSEYSYDTIKAYMEAGFIYVHAGLRGKDSNSQTYSGNAPWSVTDLKAAVRYRRYNAASIPGDAAKVYVFGHSGGGAQSAVAGASGDSGLFAPYLAALGAATTDTSGKALSDAVAGAMCWCPITTLDSANAAYEWNMGQFASSGTRAEGTWTRAYSQDLAAAFPAYLNELKLTDSDGKPLSLESSSKGTYLAGSYYDHLVAVIQKSLNDFLSATSFPYTPSSTEMAGMGPGGGGAPSSGGPDGQSSSETTTYNTVEEYIASLNSSSRWVAYDASTNTATITGLEGFVTSQKNASKDVGAFDGVDRAQTENLVMGSGENKLHFSSSSREVISKGQSKYSALSGWSNDYGVAAYEKDLATKDSVGTDMATRVSMYDPLYYLTQDSKGRGTSTIAPAWRIRTGITQGDTASTVEVNLALALQQAGAGSVDFATIWGQGHTMAELTGTGEENFIAWVTQQATS